MEFQEMQFLRFMLLLTLLLFLVLQTRVSLLMQMEI